VAENLMHLIIFHVDAFTSRPFAGNPAAVVILEQSWIADDLMQAIAAENNLSETAFVLRRDESFELAVLLVLTVIIKSANLNAC
jgi:PhzF family phenazine biosynthesis protein